MKKTKYSILALFLCFVMLLTSCGGDKSQNAQNPPTQPNQSVSQSANNTAATCQNGHKVVTDKAVAPTCAESGLTKGSHCSVCNEVIVKQETIKPNGHSMVADDKVDATCTQSGLTSGAHCVVCNEVMIAQKEISQLEHNYTDWMVRNESTCASFGVEYRTCNTCKKEETREIALNPHATMIWVTEKAATCTANGIKAKKCSACLTTFETQTIASPGHSWKDATCTAPKTCSSCKITQGSVLEHNWIAETCATPQICPDCGKVGNSETPHTFDNYECTVCGTKNSISVSKYDDNEIFYAFANSKLKINFSNFKADSLQIKEDDNTVYSASMTNVITTSLPSGAYVVSLTYYNSYETVQRLMRNPDGSYGYQYVTQGVGSQYSLVFGIVISDSNADSTYHSWYVKDYTPATCEDEGSAIVACYTCSNISEIIIPLSHIDINTDHSCDDCGANIGSHSDNKNDGDHKCDYGCGEILTSCNDVDKNHACDDCGTNIGSHSDNKNDGDHKCDYGCGEILTTCNDADKGHYCDDCGEYIGIHTDSVNDNNHECDYCGATITVCIDADNDSHCDECGGHIHNYVNSTCTICGLYRNEKSIKFGSYPQSEVTDSSLKSTLNSKAGTLPTSSNSQDWTSYGYYISGNVSNFMWYIDVEQGGEKYRGVYFTFYRPKYTTSSSSASSTSQDDNGYTTSTVYWFKYEPISWTILSENTTDGTALILCDMIIDSQEYYITDSGTRTIDGKTVYPNNYAHSTIRKWLNETLYNTAFSELQKQIILTTTVDNSVTTTNSSSNQYACENTQDKIFLLSYVEATNSSYGLNLTAARRKKTTDYAQAQGAYTSTSTDYAGNGWWWLRSPKDYNYDYAEKVFYGGDLNMSIKNDDITYTNYGVVPALQIRL